MKLVLFLFAIVSPSIFQQAESYDCVHFINAYYQCGNSQQLTTQFWSNTLAPYTTFNQAIDWVRTLQKNYTNYPQCTYNYDINRYYFLGSDQTFNELKCINNAVKGKFTLRPLSELMSDDILSILFINDPTMQPLNDFCRKYEWSAGDVNYHVEGNACIQSNLAAIQSCDSFLPPDEGAGFDYTPYVNCAMAAFQCSYSEFRLMVAMELGVQYQADVVSATGLLAYAQKLSGVTIACGSGSERLIVNVSLVTILAFLVMIFKH